MYQFKNIFAKFHHGMLEPKEPLELQEGQEVRITVIPIAKNGIPKRIELPRWSGKVYGALTRKEIYGDLR